MRVVTVHRNFDGNDDQNSDQNSEAQTGNSVTSSDTEGEARQYRSINDIYAETEPMESADEELMIMGIEEPVTYSQAAQENNWRMAMKHEIDSVEKNGTWELTELPPGRKPIELKWIYKIKRDASGEIIKHKARIVAKGYVQKQ